MKTAFTLGALATLLVAGLATAHYDLDLSAAGSGTYYVPDEGDAVGFAAHGDDFHVYEESNGCAGLQEEPVDCSGDEELEPADTIVLDL